MKKLGLLLLFFIGHASNATSALVASNEQFSRNYIEQALVRYQQEAVVGVLVNELWVVTTASMAQCFTPQSTLALEQQTMAIKQIYLEPDFQHKRGHDIALIELSEKNNQHTPIVLQQRKKEQSLVAYLYTGEKQMGSSVQNRYYQVNQPLLIDGGLLKVNNDQSASAKALADSQALRLLFTDDPKGARLLGLTNSRFATEQDPEFTRIAHYHSWLNQVMLGSVSYRSIIATELFAGGKSMVPARENCTFD